MARHLNRNLGEGTAVCGSMSAGQSGYPKKRIWIAIDGHKTARIQIKLTIFHVEYTVYRYIAWLDSAKVSASGWGSGGPRFQSHPRPTLQSCSRYRLNQLGSKPHQNLPSKSRILAGYQILDLTRLDSTRLDSTRLDSTRLDSTRLDSTRLLIHRAQILLKQTER